MSGIRKGWIKIQCQAAWKVTSSQHASHISLSAKENKDREFQGQSLILTDLPWIVLQSPQGFLHVWHQGILQNTDYGNIISF